MREYLEPSVEMLLFAEDEIILTESVIEGDGDNFGDIEEL